MIKTAVIGGSGMVASRFISLALNRLDITSLDEKTVDITNKKAVEKYFQDNSFDCVINFAAYTNVDGAEAQKGDETGIVWRLNTVAPRNLAGVCKNKNTFLIHISTDFVFPGNEENPGLYSEDSVLPDNSYGIGWYGWTKNRAEGEVRGSGCNYAIIRYGYPFRPDNYELKLDWARNLLINYSEQKLYPLFSDQIQNILFIDDMVEPFIKIIESRAGGIFHIASADTGTPYEIGKYLLEKYTGKNVDLQKGSMQDFLGKPGTTPRPRLGGLNSQKTQSILNMKFRTWREMVDEFINQYQK